MQRQLVIPPIIIIYVLCQAYGDTGLVSPLEHPLPSIHLGASTCKPSMQIPSPPVFSTGHLLVIDGANTANNALHAAILAHAMF
ncbi:hypothetical protein N7466_005586 [Penicillium verhagenii]|uniref:uncharacterized protein n=1 Tax=Penicillium verhagenii TaxID=1562060 RepID=UPI00254551DB|nr:uncharacterized protein N7466_005586 [Penicillium verhagenii]KAJ5930093.1 hypothetical protein N7466_005586 [Penicillium verhagenii]